MKVEVDVQLLRDAKRMIFEEVVSGYGRSGRAAFGAKIVDAFTGAIDEAEQRAAAERDEAITEALEDIGDIAGLLRVRADDRAQALRQIHDIAAGVLGDDEDVRASKNDVEDVVADIRRRLLDVKRYLVSAESIVEGRGCRDISHALNRVESALEFLDVAGGDDQ